MVWLIFITLKDLSVGGDLLKRQAENHTLHGSAQEGKPSLRESCQ